MKQHNIAPIAASIPAWCYIQLTGRTNRLKCDHPDFVDRFRAQKGPQIFALWHSRIMLPVFYFRRHGIAVIISNSRDGEYFTQVMNRFGFHAARGSTSRNGSSGLLGLAHWLQQGGSVVVTPDGPRGPRECVQPGIIHLAKMSGIPVVPVSISCTRNYRFHSWDRFMLPLPFGTTHLAIGNPIEVPKEIDGEGLEEKRLAVEDEMRRVTRLADQVCKVEILDPAD
ncbi:MAG: lysophospholipid acyltransferase family protein [Candidatus Omnitrophica bacterium]|nr:lysophospholipid acyltransferase family protein [Candidatus Omnitrophota bacterium]